MRRAIACRSTKNTAARQRALAVALAANAPDRIAEWCHRIPEEELATYPIDQSDGGGRRRCRSPCPLGGLLGVYRAQSWHPMETPD